MRAIGRGLYPAAMDQDSFSPSARIAILVHSMNEGGAQLRLVSLANRFAACGHGVDFIAVSGAGSVGRLLAPAVRQVTLVPPGKHPLVRITAGLAPLKHYLTQHRPAVLMAGSNQAHAVAALACAAQSEPPLLVLRAARHPQRAIPWSRPWRRLTALALRPVERWTLGRADLVIAVSNASAAAIAAMAPDPARVIAIPNPTITEAFRASLATRVEHRWFDAAEAGGDPVVLGVGRLSTAKNFETLVEAVGIANRTRPVRLILLGEGKRRAAVEALVAKLGLGERVELAGHVKSVGPWLARADLLVSSSLWEGSPGAIIEALEAGLPVVATACPGGSAELLDGTAGGLLVPMRDPAAMAEAIVAMLARPRERAAICALAQPYQDDGRADLAYLAAFEAATKRKAAAPA